MALSATVLPYGMRVGVAALLLLSCAALPPNSVGAQAARKFPVTTPNPPEKLVTCLLDNGDQLSGRLVSVTRTYVRVVNSVLGRVSLYRPNIAWCTSDDPDVERKIAAFMLPAEPPLLGDSAIHVSRIQLATIQQKTSVPKEALLRRPVAVPLGSQALPNYVATVGWKRKLAGTFSFARGNAHTSDLGFSGSVARRTERSQALLSAVRRMGKNNGNVSSDFFNGTLRYDQALGHPDSTSLLRPSYFSETILERDPLAKLRRRVVENTGISIPLSADPMNNLALEIGGGFNHELYQDRQGRTRVGGLLRLAAKQKLGSTNTDQQVSTYPDLGGPVVHYRFDTNLNLAAPLSKILAFKFGVINRYDTKPQYQVKKNDFIVQTGLGVEF